MIGQQRNILAAMGIDVWIPRDVVCQKNTAPSLWRDQIIDQPTQYSEPVQNNDARITQDAPMASVETQPAIVRESSQQVELDEKPVVKDSVIEKEQIVITAPVQAFELQMYVLENCALLVESSQLNDAQRQLWQNIQKARLGQYAELKWPFPLAAFQLCMITIKIKLYHDHDIFIHRLFINVSSFCRFYFLLILTIECSNKR